MNAKLSTCVNESGELGIDELADASGGATMKAGPIVIKAEQGQGFYFGIEGFGSFAITSRGVAGHIGDWWGGF